MIDLSIIPIFIPFFILIVLTISTLKMAKREGEYVVVIIWLLIFEVIMTALLFFLLVGA
jgi:hypothetical protein